MIQSLALIISLSLLSGCTYLSKKFESMTEDNTSSTADTSKALAAKKRNYCPANSKFQYISEDEYTSKFYSQLHPTLFENKNNTFAKKAVMFSLLEMSRRPDRASPYSRLQFYLRLNGKTYYYDFRSKNVGDDQKMPFMKGLETVTQKFIPGQTLLGIASEMDSIVPKGMVVSQEFENFLRDNRADMAKSDELTSRFFKGDEVITRYETFDRINYRALADIYLKNFSKSDGYEFDKDPLNLNKSPKENFQANCNYNLNKEMTLRDAIVTSDQKLSHYIGLSEGNDFFLAVTSSDLVRPFTAIPKLGYIMKTKMPISPLPICEFKGKTQDIVLFSSNGRNPVQHLQHLVAYDIDQIDSPLMLNELLNFSRHLFLSNPDRILYESKRGRKAQLDFFLAMNFPIYHVDALGNLFGHASFKNDKRLENILYSDDRSSARIWCK